LISTPNFLARSRAGRELGARYVLEGSVRKGRDRLRITVQLVDAGIGNHLCTDEYDGAIDDVFDLQDKITAGVVGAIEPNVRRAEIERAFRKRPENLDAYDLYLQALPRVGAHSPADSIKARGLIEEALEIDPGYAAAHALAAYCHHVQYTRGDRDPMRPASAVRHARAALATGTDDSTALATAAFVLAFEGRDFDTALGALDWALAINPNSALALGRAAQINVFIGNYDKAIEQAHQSIRLSPFDPLRYIPESALAFASRTTLSFVRRYNSTTTPTRFRFRRALEGTALAAAGGLPRPPLPPHEARWWIRSSFRSFSFASRPWISIRQIGAQRDDACPDSDVTRQLARSSSRGVAVAARWIWCWCGHPEKPLIVRDAAGILTRRDSDGSDILWSGLSLLIFQD
jgi:tetratricopeptide (TPR) repeat protein